jgi:hypothetical protein
MVQRKIFPASGGYSIAVASEQMAGGKWAAVATVTHSTETAQRTIDLPVSQERFPTEADAERWAVDQARAWIEQNAEPDSTARSVGGG